MGKPRATLDRDERQRVADVFTTHRDFIEAVAARHAPAQDLVPDIVQTVGMQVCTGLNGFRSRSEITTWLYRVTVNTARKIWRMERRHIVNRDDLDVPAVERPAHRPSQPEHPDDALIRQQRFDALHEAVTRLRNRDRLVICDDLSDAGVQSSSRQARYRARQRLKELLDDDPRLD
jgi:RNA polymerase sigma-70 factor (ECF subfamily)